MSTRHKWTEIARERHRTTRRCDRCGLFKITRHEWEGGREQHWIEFWCGTDRLVCEATPPCQPSLEELETRPAAGLEVHA